MRYLVAAFFVILLTSITTPFVSASSGPGGHGCASPLPPGISGSPAPAPAVSGVIDINEVLLDPKSTWNCSENPSRYFFNNDVWIELYNTQNQPFNLYAAHAFIDSGPNTNAYYFPFNAAIAAHSYLVIFPRINSSFASTETSTLRLVIPDVIIDQVTVPTLGPDQSYARTSDGASSWAITSTPTIDASNTSLQVTPTPTLTTSSGKQTSSGRTGTGNTTYGNVRKALINGAQPQWEKLQLPATTSTSTVDLAPTTLSSTPSQSQDGLDLPRRIALTILAIALALASFWCWRVFKRA